MMLVINSDIIRSGGETAAVVMTIGDWAFVMPGVVVAHTRIGALGVFCSGGASVSVDGSVIGGSAGIELGLFQGGSTRVIVGTQGVVRGVENGLVLAGTRNYIENNGSISNFSGIETYHGAVSVFRSSIVVNHGVISSSDIGLNSNDGVLTLTNTGEISGGIYAIRMNEGTFTNEGDVTSANIAVVLDGAASITNTGSINGGPYSISASDSAQRIINQGTLVGDVALAGGTDVFNGSEGRVVGVVFGSDGNDTLIGGDADDNFSGGNDPDSIRGNGGRDIIEGNAGDDTIDGGADVDALFGNEGNDIIFFSIEDAVVNGGSGSDTARNTYNDFGLTFDMGANSIEFYFGSQAGETIVTSANVRMDVDAGGGNDLIIGGGQGDGLAGGGGGDTILGGLGPDTIGGGFGDDRIESGGGNDVLNGESGNDTFIYEGIGGGNDTINGFEIGRDKIEILRSGFLSPTQWNAGALDPARFVASAAPAPILGTACFLFDNAGPGAGQVFWNDGSGAATGIFQVTGINFGFFSAQDFVLV